MDLSLSENKFYEDLNFFALVHKHIICHCERGHLDSIQCFSDADATSCCQQAVHLSTVQDLLMLEFGL